MLIIATILLAAIAPVTVDKTAHSVTFTARPTDITAGTTVEFAFVGPESDRAYEALFVTDARITEIAKAFDEAEIPRGKSISQSDCRFWPVGNTVEIKPSLSRYLEAKEEDLKHPILFTGGLRDRLDVPVADTNMPSALFALYGLDQSLLAFDTTGSQSSEYGKYLCRKQLTPGEHHAFTISWDGARRMEHRRIVFRKGKIREAIESLKGASRTLDVVPDFSAELTASEARAAATALSVVDSPTVRINGFVPGQIYHRGFLPDELWRERSKRLTQPLEVHVDSTNITYTVVDEDWSVEGDDPKLTPRDIPLADVTKDFKGDTCLFFVKPTENLGRIYSLMSKLPCSIRNWYVFID